MEGAIAFGIGAYGFYKIVELFVRKKERMMVIEKSLENCGLNKESSIEMNINMTNKYTSLRLGLICLSLGGCFLIMSSIFAYNDWSFYLHDPKFSFIFLVTLAISVGLASIVSFLIEQYLRGKDLKEKYERTQNNVTYEKPVTPPPFEEN